MGLDFNGFLLSYRDGEFDDVNIEFNNEDKEKLTNSFSNKESNQYYFLIINKVLENKSFSLDRSTIIENLLPILDTIEPSSISSGNDKDGIATANIIATFLSVIDIEEFSKTEF